jgi:uncharacterized protein YkwD
MSDRLRVLGTFRRQILALTVAVRVVAFFAGAPDAALAAAPSVEAQAASVQATDKFSPQDFLALTNEYRVAAGQQGLALNDRLNAAAEAKALDMAAKGYWDHFRPSDHKAPWDFITEAGYSYNVAGENLAYGFRTPEGITHAWMESPTHRANLLSAKYQDVGFACVEVIRDGAPVLLTVQMFGAPR